MPELTGETFALHAEPDGSALSLVDVRRSARWDLDPESVTVRYSPRGMIAVPDEVSGVIPLEAQPLGRPKIDVRDGAMTLTYASQGGTIRYVWRMERNHVEVMLDCGDPNAEFVALPGVFRAHTGSMQALIPTYQGVLIRSSSKQWQEAHDTGGHPFWSMSMAALLGEGAALLCTQESITDWVGLRGERADGPFFGFEARRCAVDGWYPHRVRFYATDPDVTSVCKAYRRRVSERGELVRWPEKIARKPRVADLFGALFSFIGYNRDPSIDYAASAARLAAMGFESVFYYPVRMAGYSMDFLMGGDAPIWLDDAEIAKMRAVPGAHVAPWGWTFEALDDGSERATRLFRHDPQGHRVAGWKIDTQQWYQCCIPYEIESVRERLQGDLEAMDWMHYDVTAMRPGKVCFNPDHELHGRLPLSKRQSLELTQELLGPSTNGHRIVSSEGFVDRYAPHYEIGTTKLYPRWGDATVIPVPMTSLVFHDVAIHDWWEVHNYNAHPGFAADSVHRVGVNGAGRPKQKAALDALYGYPPNVFPFGKQYGWEDFATRKTFSYRVTLDDAAVQEALGAALPVARLHRTTGPLELMSFSASDDYAVQTTLFADGTRVAANFADERRDSALGPLGPESFRAVDADGELIARSD